VAFNGPTRRKNGTRLVHVCFMFVWLVEWPVSCRYWPCTIVRVFFRRPFTRKGHIFCLWGSLWRLFCSNTGETRSGGGYQKSASCGIAPPVQMNADLSTTARASLFFSIALSTKPTLPPIFRRPGRTQLAGLTIPRRLAWPTALLVPLLALYLEPLPGS